MVAEGAIFVGDVCDDIDTIRTDSLSETTLGAYVGWGETTVDCGGNSDGNVGGGDVGLSGISIAGGAVTSRLRSVSVFLITFCISSPHYREVTVGLGSARRNIISTVY